MRAALETAVDGIIPVLPTAWQNDSFDPIKGVAWQRVTILTGRPENQVMDTSFKENGVLRISLFYPLRIGSALASQRIDLIRSVFPRDTKLVKDNVTVTTVGTPEKTSEQVETDWYSVVIDIRFFSEITV
jgi:uncharacterized protein DUF4128